MVLVRVCVSVSMCVCVCVRERERESTVDRDVIYGVAHKNFPVYELLVMASTVNVNILPFAFVLLQQ